MKTPHGWKTRLSSITRDRRWLATTAVMMLAAGYAVACAIVWQPSSMGENSLRHRLQAQLLELPAIGENGDRELALWLHDVTNDMPALAEMLELEVPALAGYLASGRLWDMPVKAAIQNHAGPLDQQSLFHDYIVARLDDDQGEAGRAAWKRLESAAARVPPAPMADEFLGYLLDAADMPMEALHAFQREAQMPSATHAREYALELAIDLEERAALREMLSFTLVSERSVRLARDRGRSGAG